MQARTHRIARSDDVRLRATRPAADPMLFAAPIAAVFVAIASEWLDFRALRYPLLLIVLAGVLATSYALDARAFGTVLRSALRTIVIGVATWGAAEAIYVLVHAARGEPFDAERFGPQWSQALGLIAVHASVLGAPTGLLAALLLQARARIRRERPA